MDSDKPCEWCGADGDEQSGIYACEVHAGLRDKVGDYRTLLKPCEWESPTWRKVRLAQSRCRKALEGIPTGDTEARESAVAAWQASERIREAKERTTASPKPRRAPKKGSRKVKVKPITHEPTKGFTIALDCFRASGAELKAMGTPEAAAEIARRKAKREGKVIA